MHPEVILLLVTGLLLTPVWAGAAVRVRPGALRAWAAVRAVLALLVLVLLVVDPLFSLLAFFALIVAGPLLFGGASLGLSRGQPTRASTLSALFGGLALALAALAIVAFFLEFRNINLLSTGTRPWTPTGLAFAVAFPASLACDAAAGWAWSLKAELHPRAQGWHGAVRFALMVAPALSVLALAQSLLEGASGPICVGLSSSLPVSALLIWALPLRVGIFAGLAGLVPTALLFASVST